MCGIIGVISDLSVRERILSSLGLLEYRGYDSAGIAMIANNNFKVCKSLGKISSLIEATKKYHCDGNIGIGHTRWATHGKPKIENTHPIVTANTAAVHNGIIENYQELKADLLDAGYKFYGDTDTEIIPNIIDFFQNNGSNLIESVLLCANKLKGAFAVALLSKNNPDFIIAIKQGSPLVVGLSKDKRSCCLASDSAAIAEFCEEVTYLEDGQIAIIESGQYRVIDFDGKAVAIKKEKIKKQADASIQDFPNFMLKEIYEQPEVIANIVKYYKQSKKKVSFAKVKHIKIIACGTSMYASCIAKIWFEARYGINTAVEIASEFANKKSHIIKKDELFFFISQSGETADTLASLKIVKNYGGKTIGIVNHKNSSIAKLVDELILMEASMEIAVAATKTFLAQIAIFAILSGVSLSMLGNAIPLIKEVLENEQEISGIAQKVLVNAQKIIFIGRGIGYPLALEGALKIKELAYIPAEGLAAGELKHGSIALIDEKTPIIVIAPEDHNLSKITSNIHEIKARGGRIILVACKKTIRELKDLCNYIIEVPEYGAQVMIPFVYAPVLQLFAYHTALLKGNDVDKPRNLAKSVTVE